MHRHGSGNLLHKQKNSQDASGVRLVPVPAWRGCLHSNKEKSLERELAPSLAWRRWRDLNSCAGKTDLPDFESGPFNHLGTPPCIENRSPDSQSAILFFRKTVSIPWAFYAFEDFSQNQKPSAAQWITGFTALSSAAIPSHPGWNHSNAAAKISAFIMPQIPGSDKGVFHSRKNIFSDPFVFRCRRQHSPLFAAKLRRQKFMVTNVQKSCIIKLLFSASAGYFLGFVHIHTFQSRSHPAWTNDFP